MGRRTGPAAALSAPLAMIKKVCLGLRVTSYICGFAGMGMYLAARGMAEPGRTEWGQRAFIFLTVMFCGFIACYVLAFATNAVRKRSNILIHFCCRGCRKAVWLIFVSVNRAGDGKTEMTQQLYKQSIKRGAIYLIASAAVFSCVGAIVKKLTFELPLEMVVFFRSFAGFLVLVPLVLMNRSLSLKTSQIRVHLARAVSGVMAMYCFFYTISKVQLAEAVILNFMAPLMIPLIAFWLLRERVPRHMPRLLFTGFIGVMLIVKPGTDLFKSAAIIGCLSALFAAFALVNIRKLTRTEPAIRVVFYFAAIASIITFIPMIRVWVNPSQTQWGLLFAMGAFASLGQWLITRGYASAPAGQVGYFQYSAVIFAGIIDWLIWGSRLDGVSITGVLLICAAGVIASQKVASPPPGRAV